MISVLVGLKIWKHLHFILNLIARTRNGENKAESTFYFCYSSIPNLASDSSQPHLLQTGANNLVMCAHLLDCSVIPGNIIHKNVTQICVEGRHHTCAWSKCIPVVWSEVWTNHHVFASLFLFLNGVFVLLSSPPSTKPFPTMGRVKESVLHYVS